MYRLLESENGHEVQYSDKGTIWVSLFNGTFLDCNRILSRMGLSKTVFQQDMEKHHSSKIIYLRY